MNKKQVKAKIKNRIRKQKSRKARLEALSEEDRLTEEAMVRMERQLKNQAGVEHVLIRNKSLEKMSDALLEYAEPFINMIDTDNKMEYEKAIMMSIVLWNCSILQDDTGNRKKIEEVLNPIMFDAESKMMVQYMLNRKRVLFPDIKRKIINYELTEISDGFHLTVMSTVEGVTEPLEVGGE